MSTTRPETGAGGTGTDADRPLRLAQISDTHLSRGPATLRWGLDNQACLEQVLELALRRRPDALLLTGDLVHDESPAGYRRLAGMLSAGRVESLCLPGNHDSPTRMRRYLAGATIHCGGVHRLGPWLAVMLDSHLEGSDAGLLSAGELTRLEQALRGTPGSPALVCVHHHPLPVGSAWLDPLGLRNAEELFRVVARHGNVRAILCGHVHQAFESRRGQVRILSAPATTRQFLPRSPRFRPDSCAPGYRWLVLHPSGELETGIERLVAGGRP